MRRLLGEGKARDFQHLLQREEICEESGRQVYAVTQDEYCQHCDGKGCRSCEFTGLRKTS